MAEDAARELPNLPLEEALQLVHLYAERGSPKYERAALRWLERYLVEGSSTHRPVSGLRHRGRAARQTTKASLPLFRAGSGTDRTLIRF